MVLARLDQFRYTIDEFIFLYDEQAEKAKAVDAFNGDPLNPEVLEFTVLDEE